MQRSIVHIPTADGWRLEADLIVPPSPMGALVVGHAMMLNRTSMDHPPGQGVASTLAEAGFVVLNVDLRGRGASLPHASRRVDWSYDDLVFGDTPALVEFMQREWGELPLALVGHSLFGHVAAGYLGFHPDTPVRALAAFAANLWARQWEQSRVLWWRKRLAMEATTALTYLFGVAPARRFRQGTDDEARTYYRQLCHWTRHGVWRTLDGRDYLAAIARARQPMLNVIGARDRFLCTPDNARAMWRHWGGPYEQWVIDESWGLGYVPAHVGIVLNPACRPVWERMAQWLKKAMGLASSASMSSTTKEPGA